jgi:hypothetical protein
MAKPVTNLDFEEFSGTWSVAEAEAEAFDAVLADIPWVDPAGWETVWTHAVLEPGTS